MISTRLTAALKAAQETRGLELGQNILEKTPELFRQEFGDQPAVLVSDPATFAAAGDRVQKAFERAGNACLPRLLLDDPHLYAEHRFVDQLQQSLQQHQAIPVAVGGGTINDLTKLAAHRCNRSYLCVPTAASMDGYTAFGASITYQNSKQTFTCPAPRAVLVDLKIIAAAPAPMNAWGYADLLAKITAGADWIIADALGMEAIQPEAWAIIQDPLRELVSDPSGVRHGRIEAVAKLMEGLLLGGFAMQSARTSRSASGAEHQFSHLWDMQHHTHQGNAPSHGFKVGIGTLAATALYEFILAQPIHKMDVAQTVENWPQENELPKIVNASFAQKDLVEIAVRECQAKWVTREQLANQLRDLQNAWPELVTRLKQQLIPFQELRSMLVEAGAPVEPEDIGITRERLRQSFFQAYCIRRRFTILDLALRLNLLDDSLKHIFGPAGPWPIQETILQR